MGNVDDKKYRLIVNSATTLSDTLGVTGATNLKSDVVIGEDSNHLMID